MAVKVSAIRREDYKRLAAKLPPFANPVVRDRAVRAVRELRRRRRLVFERFGSERYSRPNYLERF